MKATPAKTLRARPDSQRPPEQQPRFYDSPTTRFDGSSASSNSSIDLAPGLILRKKQTRLGQIDSLSTTPNVQPYSQQSKENSDLPRALTEEFPSVCTSHTRKILHVLLNPNLDATTSKPSWKDWGTGTYLVSQAEMIERYDAYL